MTDAPTYEGWTHQDAWETHLAISNTKRLNDRNKQIVKEAKRWGASVEILAYEMRQWFAGERNATDAAWLELAEAYSREFDQELEIAVGQYVTEIETDHVVSTSHHMLGRCRSWFGRRVFDAACDAELKRREEAHHDPR